MPAFTAHLNLYLPGGGSLGIGGDDEPADIDKLNEDFQKIDAWAEDTDTTLGNLTPQLTRNQQFTGPASDRTAVTGMKRGDTYQEMDGDFDLYVYDGANWKNRSPVSASLTSGTGLVNGTATLSWSNSSTVHYRDTGGFWAVGTPTEILFKRSGWYRLSYTVRGNGVAPINVTPEINAAVSTYLGTAGTGAAGASSTAGRTIDYKAAANDKLVFKAISTASMSGTHNLIVEYLGEY